MASSENSTNNQDEENVTMVDVLKEERELVEGANAVLGDTNQKECSYNLGYMKRQPLYSCRTCSIQDSPSGICLACSYHCHDGHDLVELYTKRNFRCDCGNDLQPNTTCQLTNKTGKNEDNRYNQNFEGKYCECMKPYPDEEFDDEMIQCVVCEDWFHTSHLHAECPDTDSYSEMTCMKCVNKLPFLKAYYNRCDLSLSSADETSSSAAGQCDIASKFVDGELKTVFWKDGWRSALCKCVNCMRMYGENEVSFLLDKEDTISYHESRAGVAVSDYDEGMRLLSSMDRVQQIEVVHEYNHLKSELMDYLKEFAQNKRVVREDDIKEFFSGLNARKKPRVNIPHSCR